MKKSLCLLYFVVLTLLVLTEGKKLSWGRGTSNRRTSGTSYKPAPTSYSHAQPIASAPKSSYNVAQKPSLFGWQEKPAGSRQSKPTQTHSYPSSGTGLSGNGNHRSAPSQHDNVQKSHSYPQSSSGYGQQSARSPQNSNANQQNHGYPSSHGMSGNGNSGAGSGYPASPGLSGNNGPGYPKQQGGLSGASQSQYPNQHSSNGAAPPPYSASGHVGGAPPPYPGNNGAYHAGTNYNQHHQGQPPPYNNYGGGLGGYGGGYGGYHPNSAPQMPGYFGNYGNYGHGGYGGVSRTSSALKGVGIAGAGIGTVLTGLALWNLARSTGRQHHTVIYDNRGQPVAVAPDNSTNSAAANSILADLVNCSLTIDNGNATEVLAIPCAIATSFTPDAKVEDLAVNNGNEQTKCTITVLTKAGREFLTTIPCSILLNTAAANNVTEPPTVVNNENLNTTALSTESAGVTGQAAIVCSPESRENVNSNTTIPCNPFPIIQPGVPLNETGGAALAAPAA